MKVEEPCKYGCGYILPCPGKHNCLNWNNFQYIGPHNQKIEAGGPKLGVIPNPDS